VRTIHGGANVCWPNRDRAVRRTVRRRAIGCRLITGRLAQRSAADHDRHIRAIADLAGRFSCGAGVRATFERGSRRIGF
jgi:hypothetical protein